MVHDGSVSMTAGLDDSLRAVMTETSRLIVDVHVCGSIRVLITLPLTVVSTGVVDREMVSSYSFDVVASPVHRCLGASTSMRATKAITPNKFPTLSARSTREYQ